MTSVIYEAGTVTIASGSTRVIGKNTAWLKKDVKQYDIIILGGKIYEIADVVANTELTLAKAYTGESVENSEYVIIRIVPQVIAADLAKQLQDFIDAYKTREDEYDEMAKYAEKFKKAGLDVDENHKIFQTEPEPDPIDDSDIASDDEIQALIDDVMND